jgi:hypothetical protein
MADQEPALIGSRAAVLLTSSLSADDTVAWKADPTTGAAQASLATKLAGEDLTNDVIKTEQRFSPLYISTATTTLVKTGAGFLHRIIVNGGTTGTIIAYDNTAGSGAIIFSFDTTNAIGSYEFNCSFATGLTIVTSAATKLTAVYR